MTDQQVVQIARLAKFKLTHLSLPERLIRIAQEILRPSPSPECLKLIGRMIELTRNYGK